MSHMTWREKRYRRAHLSCVRHITLDPKGPGVVRIHMIPPRTESPEDPFLLLLNGAQLVPLTLSWAVLLANFMDRLEPLSGCEISEEDWAGMVRGAVDETHRTYPRTDRALLQEDLELMLRSLVAIAQGREPDVAVGALTLGEFDEQIPALPHVHADGLFALAVAEFRRAFESLFFGRSGDPVHARNFACRRIQTALVPVRHV